MTGYVYGGYGYIKRYDNYGNAYYERTNDADDIATLVSDEDYYERQQRKTDKEWGAEW